ncbi:MAG: universal stress protein [Spirochaetes bacterium]|nr:MAG: universal stress protein [Spirochaetota bacterium]
MYKKVLIPLDGSELAEKAFEHLRSVVKVNEIEKVVLVRVVEAILPDIKSNIGAEHLHQAEEKREKEAERYLKKIAKELAAENIPAETRLVIDGEPAEKILEVAEEEDVDLIIMCSHGRSGFKRWLFGSVASKVLHHSPVPMLIAVPEEKKKR